MRKLINDPDEYVDEMLQGMVAAYPDRTVDRLETHGEAASRPSNSPSLTARQQEAVTAAFDVGYYDVPRTGTMEDIAHHLDCTEGTASQNLRRAESKVMESFSRTLRRGG